MAVVIVIVWVCVCVCGLFWLFVVGRLVACLSACLPVCIVLYSTT